MMMIDSLISRLETEKSIEEKKFALVSKFFAVTRIGLI